MYKGLALFTFLALLAPRVLAADTTGYSWQLSKHRTLLIEKPVDWQAEVSPASNASLPTLQLRQQEGPAFVVLMTAVGTPPGEAPPMDAEEIRALVEGAASNAQAQAVEEHLEVKELRGTDGLGYYFSATDRAPAAGEYRHLDQGILPLGNLLVSFTILTNDGQKATVAAALRLLQGMARQGGSTAR